MNGLVGELRRAGLTLGMGSGGEEGAPNNRHNYEVTEHFGD